MPLTRLTIDFGGLCLIVQRAADPKGLYVLLPEGHSHSNPEDTHCQMAITSSSNTTKALIIPFHEDLDLSMLAPHTASVGRLIDVAEISKLAGNVPVETKWFTDRLTSPLAARVRLPLGTSIRVAGDPGKVLAPSGPIQVRGRAVVEVDVTNPMPITIGGQLLTPNSDGLICLRIVNIPFAHLDEVKREHHINEPITHIRAYHAFLKGNPTVPDLLVGEDVPAGANPWPYRACPIAIEDAPDKIEPACPPGREFIDPFNCTIGGGCPEEQPAC